MENRKENFFYISEPDINEGNKAIPTRKHYSGIHHFALILNSAKKALSIMMLKDSIIAKRL